MTYRRVSITVVATAVLVAACSDAPSAPSAPGILVSTAGESYLKGSTPSLPGAKSGFSNGSSRAALVSCVNHGPAAASADIGPSGGIIAVGNARLILPAGALSTTVHITATQPGGANAMVSFQPSGLQFKKPAGLQFDVAGCDVASYSPDVVYMNDEGVIVERINATYSSYWHQVAAPVNHFSNYALAW